MKSGVSLNPAYLIENLITENGLSSNKESLFSLAMHPFPPLKSIISYQRTINSVISEAHELMKLSKNDSFSDKEMTSFSHQKQRFS